MLDKSDRSAQPKAAQQTASAAPAPPCAMVIFGAAGDLTKRLVVPALYNLAQAGQLSSHFQLVGFDHNARSIEQWRRDLAAAMEDFVGQGGEFHVDAIDHSAWSWLSERMSYVQGDINDAGAYAKLRDHLAALDKTAGTSGHYLFYLALSDRFFGRAVAALGSAGLTTVSGQQ